MKTVYIIGGGPSGMMAAISTKTHNPELQVILLERNSTLGKKLKVTGGGRCNVTAKESPQEIIASIPKNGKFLFSSLSHFNATDIISFFNEHACPLKEEDHARMFPTTDRSQSIIDTLAQKMHVLGVIVRFNITVHAIAPHDNLLSTSQGDIVFDYLILATGGQTLPRTGSDGLGYTLAQQCGHTITELLPAEVPLLSSDAVIQSKDLQGLSFSDVTLHISDGKKVKKTITHDLLFTHFGLSGPAALRASYFISNILKKQTHATLLIDFVPDISAATLQVFLTQNKHMLADYTTQQLYLPKRLVSHFLSVIQHTDMTHVPNQKQIETYLTLIKRFPITVYDTRGFAHAFVTNGGVNLKEIVPSTLKSKHFDNISMVGELLDISGFTGGYNITSALSTGFTAGKNICLK